MEWVRGATVGRGTFATVSLAVVNRSVIAAKSAPFSNSTLLQREESILMNLQDCPQIVACFGHDITTEAGGDQFYNLFLEYFPGGTLSDLLRRSGGSLSESAVKRYTRSILEGLRYVHSKGYVHCDVKLENILVGGGGDVKIADFGLAKKAGEKSNYCIRGTPLYMSPESVARKEYESPMDVWSVGCAVAEMVSGRPAWRRSAKDGYDDVWALLLTIGFGEELPEIPAEMSEEGKDFLSRCFVRDPQKRWTADMLLNHPFLAKAGEEEEVLQVSECTIERPSPRSVFDFSRSSSSLCSSSSVESLAVNFGAAADRIGLLATGKQPDWWRCSSNDGWINVRECSFSSLEAEDSINLKGAGEQPSPISVFNSSSRRSSLTVDSGAPADRIGLLSTECQPDWWCSSSSNDDGWISVREGCFCSLEVKAEDFMGQELLEFSFGIIRRRPEWIFDYEVRNCTEIYYYIITGELLLRIVAAAAAAAGVLVSAMQIDIVPSLFHPMNIL